MFSYVTLDLGGGSTQIVFVPGRRVEGLEGRRHYMHDVSVMGSTVAAYSHSYLGCNSTDIWDFGCKTDRTSGPSSWTTSVLYVVRKSKVTRIWIKWAGRLSVSMAARQN